MIPNLSNINIGGVTALKWIPIQNLLEIRRKNGLCHIIYEEDKNAIDIYHSINSASVNISQANSNIYNISITSLSPKESKALLAATIPYVNSKGVLMVSYSSGIIKVYGSKCSPIVLRLSPTLNGVPSDFCGLQFSFSTQSLAPGLIQSTIDLDFIVTHVTTIGGSNGSIQVLASGGIKPYLYSILVGSVWSEWQESNLFHTLTAGFYYIKAIDFNNLTAEGCTIVREEEGEVPALSLNYVALQPVPNISNGNITVNGSGGVPPYQYAISPYYFWGSSNMFYHLNDGTYKVAVKDSVGQIVESENIAISYSEYWNFTDYNANTMIFRRNGSLETAEIEDELLILNIPDNEAPTGSVTFMQYFGQSQSDYEITRKIEFVSFLVEEIDISQQAWDKIEIEIRAGRIYNGNPTIGSFSFTAKLGWNSISFSESSGSFFYKNGDFYTVGIGMNKFSAGHYGLLKIKRIAVRFKKL